MSTITLPYDVNNGDILDADKVMANEDAIVTEYNTTVGGLSGTVVDTVFLRRIATVTYGATVTFDVSASKSHKVTLTGNPALAVSNAVTGDWFEIELVQDGTGSRTVTWFSTIKWADGVVPTLTTTALKQDTFIFKCTGNGTYDGYIGGQNL